MSFLFSKPATTSSDSLLTSGSDDPESQHQDIPEPEPLGSSKALSPAVQHKWWWRKKLPGSALALGASSSSSSGSRSPPKNSNGKIKHSPLSASAVSAAFPSDGKVGFLIIGILIILATATLITVQFKDSELVLALFTGLALAVIALVYYFHCCSSSSPYASQCCRRLSGGYRKTGKVEDFDPLVLPPSSSSSSLDGSAGPGVVDSEKNDVVNGGPSSVPHSVASSVIKASPHRRDWSLPTMPTGTLLSYRRVSNGSSSSSSSSSSQAAGSTTPQLQPQAFTPPSPTAFALPQQQPYQLFSKLRVEFSLDDPVRSRVAHVATALKQLAGETDSVWIYEARLADAITTALTSCMSEDTLSEVKVAIDRELRTASLNERYDSLYSAVFSFLQKGERDAVLTHLSAIHHHQDGDEQDAQPTDRAPRSRMLISDIDDTLVPTFKDRRGFSWGVPYPGVRQLYKELVQSTSVEGEDEATTLRERVAFVTARPGLLRTWTKQEITKAGFGGSLILMGYATTATTPQGMLSQKVKQVRELRSLWPERSIILVGDNGQRDIDLGAMLLKENLVEAVFVHDIFASDEEIIRTTSTSFSGEDNATNNNSIPEEQKAEFFDDDALLGRQETDDEFSHLALNDDRRAASVQPKAMVRLISAPAALGSAASSASSRHASVSSDAEPMTSSEAKQRTVMVLEPSVPVGFRFDECSRAGIELFQTYAGAALRCFQKDLISVEALERVTRACASDLGNAAEGLVKQRLVDGFLRDVARVALEFKLKTPAEKVEFLEYVHEAIRKRSK